MFCLNTGGLVFSDRHLECIVGLFLSLFFKFTTTLLPKTRVHNEAAFHYR